jgi:hypothetical protein
VSKPEPVYIDSSNQKMYFNNVDLLKYDPVFYYGCKTKPRTIIEKKGIPEKEYFYANLKKGEWNVSSLDCKKAQLLISKEWVDKHIFKIEENITIVNEETRNTTEIVEAPPLFFLDDKEKFRDADGNIIEIETRGSQDRNNIYFKCRNISDGFNIPNLNNHIVDNRWQYIENIHYKNFFIREGLENLESPTIKKCLYLTYKGLLRVLYVSRNKHVERFQAWAEECLFTIQMGQPEEKIKLGTNILGITEKTYTEIFSKHANQFPCIYLFSLGTVGSLRETFEINSSFPNDSIVYKYGFTDNLARRMGEHESKYGKLPNVKIVLSSFHMIDPIYTSKAEGDIREECNAYEINLKTKGFKELIVLNKKQLEHLTKNYCRIGRDYAGHSIELQEQIAKLKEELRIKDYEINRLNTLVETNEKYHKLELNYKDLKIENLELRNKMLTDNK